MKKQIKRKHFANVPLICSREPHKTVLIQTVTYDNSTMLSPAMYCHNEYGLDCCFECKKKLYNYLNSLTDDNIPITKPIPPEKLH